MKKKEKLIFVVANNGSDTRVIKELKTLSKKYDLLFIGITSRRIDNIVAKYAFKIKRIPFSHKNIFAYIFLNFLLIQTKVFYKIKKMHVVDEQVWIFLFHNFLIYDTVLDIYDSYFLKLNLQGEKAQIVKSIVYGTVKKIIVTDKERLSLLPLKYQKKTYIIPNYPLKCDLPKTKVSKKKNKLTVGYFGTLAEKRGGEIVEKLLLNSNIKVISAGWIADSFSMGLTKNVNYCFLGEIKQKEVLDIVANKVDFLMSCYPENNINNIYASPNKIWDALACGKPIIINDGAKISSFVKENNLGIVINYNNFESEDLYNKMLSFKKKLIQIDKSKYLWDNYENTLIGLHL